jgi:hypothetical protein
MIAIYTGDQHEHSAPGRAILASRLNRALEAYGVEDSTDPLLGLSEEVLPERWRTRLQGLQDWICELLIKNQQLRVALMEMQAREPEDDCSGNV